MKYLLRLMRFITASVLLVAGMATTNAQTTTTSTPTITTDMQSVFDLAAEIFPSIFKNGTALATYEGYVYRYFASSGVYVGVKDNAVYLMGGQFGNAPSNKGSVANILKELQTAKAEIAKAAASNTTGGGTGGLTLYTLTLSGTFRTTGFAAATISVPSLSIPNMPAPTVSDTTVIVDQVRTQLGVSGVSNIRVTSINNTASRVTFRVEFSATISGFGSVTYDLTYDYTR